MLMGTFWKTTTQKVSHTLTAVVEKLFDVISGEGKSAAQRRRYRQRADGALKAALHAYASSVAPLPAAPLVPTDQNGL
jgi:hypothetical protein